MSRAEQLVLDYETTGVSVGDHAMKVVRPRLPRHYKSARDLMTTRNGARVSTAGMVICRQRPGTASGVVFITMEDETGFVNLILWSRTFEKWRHVATTSSMLVAHGKVERQGEVVYVVPDRLEKLGLYDGAGDEPGFPLGYRSRGDDRQLHRHRPPPRHRAPRFSASRATPTSSASRPTPPTRWPASTSAAGSPGREAWRHFIGLSGTWLLHGTGWWMVEEPTLGAVGTVGVFQRDDAASLEIGWSIDRPHWGKGFASEAAQAALAMSPRQPGRGPTLERLRP